MRTLVSISDKLIDIPANKNVKVTALDIGTLANKSLKVKHRRRQGNVVNIPIATLIVL